MTTDADQAPLRVYIDSLLTIVKDGLCRFILAQYKTTYQSTNYMSHIREALDTDSHQLDREVFLNENVLIEHVDPYGWLCLMDRRWPKLFHKKFGAVGRRHVRALQDIRNKWAHHQFIMFDEAISAVESAIYLLQESGSDAFVQQARQILQEVYKMRDKPDEPTTSQDAVASEKVNEPGEINQDVLDTATDSAADGWYKGATQIGRYSKEQEKYFVQIIDADNQTRQEKVPMDEARVLVGRGENAHIRINDRRISRLHLMLQPAPGQNGMWLTDIGSANGTIIDGNRIASNRAILWAVGQEIAIGNTLLILRQGSI